MPNDVICKSKIYIRKSSTNDRRCVPPASLLRTVLVPIIGAGIGLYGTCQAAPSSVDCRLKSGAVIPVTIEVCNEAGGQPVAALGPISAGAVDRLFADWESNSRANHVAAYQAGKRFISDYSDDPRSARVKAWIDAYEKVTGSKASEAGTGVSPKVAVAPAGAQTDGPTKAETQQWMQQFLTRELVGEKRAQRTVAEFDDCNLRLRTTVKAYVGGLFGGDEFGNFDYEIPFDKVDVSSIEALQGYWTAKEGVDGLVLLVTRNKEKVISLKKYKNGGTYDHPVNGEAIEKQPFFDFFQRIPRGGDVSTLRMSHYVTPNTSIALLFTDSAESAARLVNASKAMARFCGGSKVDPY